MKKSNEVELMSKVMQSFLESHNRCYEPGNEKTLTLTMPASRWKHLVEYLRNHSGMRDIEDLLTTALAKEGIAFPPRAEDVRNAIKVDAKPLPEDIERGQSAIKCQCGGFCDRVDCLENECHKFGCGRDMPGRECCAVAFVCCKCATRYAGAQPAPEMN